MEKGKINLGGGFVLEVPHYSDTTKLLEAIGMLVQMFVYEEIENGSCNEEDLIKMINLYVREITRKVKEKVKGNA